jgi:hypothetical protein
MISGEHIDEAMPHPSFSARRTAIGLNAGRESRGLTRCAAHKGFGAGSASDEEKRKRPAWIIWGDRMQARARCAPRTTADHGSNRRRSPWNTRIDPKPDGRHFTPSVGPTATNHLRRGNHSTEFLKGGGHGHHRFTAGPVAARRRSAPRSARSGCCPPCHRAVAEVRRSAGSRRGRRARRLRTGDQRGPSHA